MKRFSKLILPLALICLLVCVSTAQEDEDWPGDNDDEGPDESSLDEYRYSRLKRQAGPVGPPERLFGGLLGSLAGRLIPKIGRVVGGIGRGISRRISSGKRRLEGLGGERGRELVGRWVERGRERLRGLGERGRNRVKGWLRRFRG